MRLLIFLQSPEIGGAQRVAVTLANDLPAEWEIKLVCGRPGPMQRMVAPRLEHVCLNRRRARHAVLPLARLLRQWQPDVAFAPMPESSLALWAAWRLAGRGTALVLRESNHRSSDERSVRGLFGAALGRAYHEAFRVVAPSGGVAQDLCARYRLAPDRVRTIYNSASSGTSASAGTWPRTPGRIEVLAAGRFIRQKGFDVLLHAMAGIADPRVRLTVLGDGPERPALQRLADRLGISSRVRMPGFVENPASWMAASDIFVLPSRWEGMPNVLLEAMEQGMAVVATRCPGSPDEIVTHGQNGLLCEPESPTALQEELGKLLGDARLPSRLVEGACETLKRFRPAVILPQYVELFREAAAHRRGVGS